MASLRLCTMNPFNLLGVAADDWAQTPETVQLALLGLRDIVRAQSQRLRELETVVRELQAKLGQTSRTSSKPPSSDPPSTPPRPPRPARGRKAGGQVGHAGHQRPLVPSDQVHDPIELQPQQWPTGQTALPPDLPDVAPRRRTQVWELPPIEPIITEYRQHTVCCPQCQQVVTAELPAAAPPGAFGPRATALLALLRGRYRVSRDEVVEFLADVCQLPPKPGNQVVSEASSGLQIGPSDAPKSPHAAVQALRLFHSYRITKPKQPYVKFGMTHVITLGGPCAVQWSVAREADEARGVRASLAGPVSALRSGCGRTSGAHPASRTRYRMRWAVGVRAAKRPPPLKGFHLTNEGEHDGILWYDLACQALIGAARSNPPERVPQ